MATTSRQVDRTSQTLASGRVERPRQFPLTNILVVGTLFVVSIYFLLPCYWLVISATKTSADLFGTFGLWFTPNFNLLNNLQTVFTYDSGLYAIWLWNSFLYSSVSALIVTLFS